MNVAKGDGLVIRNGWLDELRRAHVIEPIRNDARNTGVYDTLLGHEKKWIFFNAIGGGQANFDEPIRDLQPRDRAMLYAWFNQDGHVVELSHAFEQLLTNPASLEGATVVDVGCGPFTAGLSLANVGGNGVVFRYFGIDIAQSMRDFGSELAAAARAAEAFHPNTHVSFETSLDDIDFGQPRAGWTIVILSYLLASDTLDVASVVNQIVRACDRIGLGPVGLLYTNTAREDARRKYPELKERLLAAGFELKIEDLETLAEGGKTRHIHYALFTRERPSALPFERFTT